MGTYIYDRPDGSPSQPVGITKVMVAAAKQVVSGHGPFTVVRDEYNHPGLTRRRALAVLRRMCLDSRPGDDLRVRTAARVVFHVRCVPKVPVYQNPLRDCAGVRGLREDQGVDYSVVRESPVYAIGPGVITVYRPTSGWPWDSGHADGGAYIAYRLTEGPAKGMYVYDAEHIRLNRNLQIGSKVDSNTPIATHLPGFANCELGWASASSNGYSPLAEPYYTEGARTAAGVNFDRLMRALGAPAGLAEGRPVKGRMPRGWPRRWKGKV